MQKKYALFHLTWPLFMELVLFTLLGFVDTYMVSRIADEAVAGVGAANQLLQLATVLLQVMTIGMTILMAQYLGAKKFQEVQKIGTVGIQLATIFGLLGSLLFITSTPFLLERLNLTVDVFPYAQFYLLIVGGGLFIQAIIQALTAIIRVHGKTKQVMYVTIFMNLLNVIGNYLLIFGKLGLPAMGVVGAAIATIFSKVIIVLPLWWLVQRTLASPFTWRNFFQLNSNYRKSILAIGFPSAIEKVLYRGYQVTLFVFVTTLGTTAIAARQYAMNLTEFVYLVAIALGSGTALLIGHLIGKGDFEAVDRQLKQSLRWASSCTVILVIFLLVGREPLLNLFTSDPLIMQLASTVLLYSLFVDTGGSINIVLVNALRATGDAKYPVYIGIASMLGIGLPIGYFLIVHTTLGLVGMWIALGIDEWVRVIILKKRWKSQKWKQYRLIDPKKEGE